ncbi:hypothetical protein ACFQE1_19325 [Halobium palmae]|uniref:Uncharacterized protein n=1 Tax=Halobium palmae TaxID=1776492 RepID=A0ABD5S4B5_9EURY
MPASPSYRQFAVHDPRRERSRRAGERTDPRREPPVVGDAGHPPKSVTTSIPSES